MSKLVPNRHIRVCLLGHLLSVFLFSAICGANNIDNISNEFYFNTSSRWLSFGTVQCLFCVSFVNVSLVNSMNKSILIDKYSVNDSQFRIESELSSVLSGDSSINLSIRFVPLARGSFWSHLSVHSDHGVLYLYLYGVGSDNIYGMSRINMVNDSYPLMIVNPFNDTLIINNISLSSEANGLYLSNEETMSISAKSESRVSWISMSPSPSPKACDYLNDLIVDTNYDTLSVPIMIDCKLKKKSKRRVKSKYQLPVIDFLILTRPNMTVSKKITFKNSGSRSVLVTGLEIEYNKYIRIEAHFNRSYLVLPSKVVELGRAIFIAVPNRNKYNKPIKTNEQINASLSVEFIETSITIDKECQDIEILESAPTINGLFNVNNECIDNENYIKILTKHKKHRLNTAIKGWILLGNLNYSFQQSLFYPKSYWNHTTKQREYVTMEREMTMQNNFLIPLKLESLCIFNCIQMDEIQNWGQMDFEIIDFYNGKRIIDGENATICKLKFEAKSNQSNYDTQLILNTNITSFQIPITVYNGRVNIFYANMTNDRNEQINIDETEHNKEYNNIDIHFGDIPMDGKLISTFELRNGNPLHLSINPFNNNNKVFDDSFDALFDDDDNNKTMRLFLYQRQSDMTVKSVHTVNKYEYAYLAIGIHPKDIDIGHHVLYTVLNITANNSEHNTLSTPEFMTQFDDASWFSTAISWYLLRIRVEFTVYDGSFDMKPNPIWFDDSFPGKQIRSTTLTMYNYYDTDIIINTKQSHLMHSMFGLKYPSKKIINIKAHSTKDIAKIYFNPNTKYTKYGNYIYINSTETFLLSHFELLSAPKHLRMKYLIFRALINTSFVDLSIEHEINIYQKGINLREIFIEQYRNFLWNKILSSNDDIAQTVAYFYSPNVGKIPFIVYGHLIMPCFIMNDEDKWMDFGNVMVGDHKSFNISVQNPFNRSVQMALIIPTHPNDAIFFPSVHNILVLEPYSIGILGPIEFRPKQPKSYHQMLYIRNNITTIESFNVSGVGKQGKLKIIAVDDLNENNNDDDDDENEDLFDDTFDDLEAFDDDELDIIYPLNMVDSAYFQTSKSIHLKKAKVALNSNKDKDNNNKERKDHRRPHRVKDDKGGYIYHIPKKEESFHLWDYFQSKSNINKVKDEEVQFREEEEKDDSSNSITIEFNPNEYGLYETGSNSYDFVDFSHRHMFMNKLNSGHSLVLRKKFRAKNDGNIAITLEGMTIINSNDITRVNDTLFSTQSTCIYDVNMFPVLSKDNKTKDNKTKTRMRRKYKRHKQNVMKKQKQKKTKYKKWITNWISFIKKYMTEKWNNATVNINNNTEKETVTELNNNTEKEIHYKMNDSYYLEQNGMNYVYYNESDVIYDSLWSLNKYKFGIIGCEMFPMRLKPGEYHDFVLIFNYDLSSHSVSKHLYIKTCHLDIINNSVYKSNSSYFTVNAAFDVNLNLFDSISALKPLEKGKKFIFLHSFRLMIFLMVLITINIFMQIIKRYFNVDIALKCKVFAMHQMVKIMNLWSVYSVYLNPIYDFLYQYSLNLYKMCIDFVDSIKKSKKLKKMKQKLKTIKGKWLIFWQNIIVEFDIISQKNEFNKINDNNDDVNDDNNNNDIDDIDQVKNDNNYTAPLLIEEKLIKSSKTTATSTRDRRKNNNLNNKANNVVNNNNSAKQTVKIHTKQQQSKSIRKKAEKLKSCFSINSRSLSLSEEEMIIKKKEEIIIKKERKKNKKQNVINIKKKTHNKVASPYKARTVLISSSTKGTTSSYASRAKGIQNGRGKHHHLRHHHNNNNNKHRNWTNKPRKPPRPHHPPSVSSSESPEIRTVIDELLAESKTIKDNNNVSMDKKGFESPDTISSSSSVHTAHTAPNPSITGISLNSLYPRHTSSLSSSSSSKKERKPPINTAKKENKIVISDSAELVIPLNVKVIDYNSMFNESNESVDQMKKSNINKIWTNYNENEDEKVIGSTLNTKATPFVPKHAKYKYNSKGELKKNRHEKKKNKNSKKEKIHTFSSLYGDNDSNSFLLKMAKAINGNNNNNNNYDQHYNRILKDYPFNYSSTPSPKHQQQQSNGFGIDLQSLGYNISPNRPQQTNDDDDDDDDDFNESNINLPKELAPQNSLEIGIENNLNSIINNNDDHRHITSKDLFAIPTFHHKTMNEKNKNDDNDKNITNNNNTIRLSQLF